MANRTSRAHALKLNLPKLLVVTNNWVCMFGTYQWFFLMVLAYINVEKGEPKASFNKWPKDNAKLLDQVSKKK